MAAVNRSNVGFVSRIRRALFPVQDSLAEVSSGNISNGQSESKNGRGMGRSTSSGEGCDSLMGIGGAVSKPARPSTFRRGQRDKANKLEAVPPSLASIVLASNNAEGTGVGVKSSRGRRRAKGSGIHMSVLDKLPLSPKARGKKTDRRSDVVDVLGTCAASNANRGPDADEQRCSLSTCTLAPGSDVPVGLIKAGPRASSRAREAFKKSRRSAKNATKSKITERRATRAQIRVKRSRFISGLGQDEDTLASLTNPSSTTMQSSDDMRLQLPQTKERDDRDVQDILGQSLSTLREISPFPSTLCDVEEEGHSATSKEASRSPTVLKSPLRKTFNVLSKRQRNFLSPSRAQARTTSSSTPSSTIVALGSPSPVPNPPKRRDQKKTPAKLDDSTYNEEKASVAQITVSAEKTKPFFSLSPRRNREGSKENGLATRLFEEVKEIAIENVVSRSTSDTRSASERPKRGAGSGSLVLDLEKASERPKREAGPGSLVHDLEKASERPKGGFGPGSLVLDLEEAEQSKPKIIGARKSKANRKGRSSNIKADNANGGGPIAEQAQSAPKRRSTRRQVPTDRLSVTWESDRRVGTPQDEGDNERCKEVTNRRVQKRAPKESNSSTTHEANAVASPRPRRRVKKVERLSVSWKEPDKDSPDADRDQTSNVDKGKVGDDMFSEYEQLCKMKRQSKTKPLAQDTEMEALEATSPTTRQLKKTISQATMAVEKSKTQITIESSSPRLQWTHGQIQILRRAYNEVDPTLPNFWEEIAARVDDKSAMECRDKWFSLVQTPKARSRKPAKSVGQQNLPHVDGKQVASADDDDDIFNSTPFRAVAQTTTEHTTPSDADVQLPCDFSSPIGHSPLRTLNDIGSDNDDTSPLRFRIGYKGYVKGLAKVRRKGGIKMKGRGRMSAPRLKQNSERPVSAKVGAGDVHMNGVLTPGGTVEVRAPTESDLEDLVIRPGEEYSDDEESIDKENALLMMD